MKKINSVLQSTQTIIIPIAIMGFLVLVGCDNNDVTGPEDEDHGVEDIVIEPQSVEFEVGTQQAFEAFLLDAEGDTVDPSEIEGFNIQWEWWSTDTEVFVVEQDGSGGIATSENSGEAYCVIEVTITDGTSNFSGRDSSFVMVF